MKHLLAIAALSIMAISGATAVNLNFSQADSFSHNMGTGMVLESQAGDGQVSMMEAWQIGITMEAFMAADTNQNGKLTPTEYKNLK